MVNVFPDLLIFGLLAPFIIRLFLGFYFLLYSIQLFEHSPSIAEKIHKGHILSAVAFAGSICILAGFFTQGAAIALAFLSLYRASRSENKVIYILLFGMSVSLLFSGAGFFAFDIPL